MAPTSGREAIVELSSVVSDVMDVIQDVKQALRKVPQNDALHAELDRVFADLRSWAQLLIEEDEELGASLADVTSVAGRRPPNLFPGPVTDEDVRRTVSEHLDRVAQHLSVASAELGDEGLPGPHDLLARIGGELDADVRSIKEQ
ncbi:MAG TPA: hypothetical protein VEJ87_07210 [Acidimicrobiales bacterium]|nr:hypothetical protein [Acidimicrobiales bacterium]